MAKAFLFPRLTQLLPSTVSNFYQSWYVRETASAQNEIFPKT